MSEVSDELLFVAYCQGDSAAFEQLFNRYQNRLCLHLERMLKDRNIAEDLVVETFLRLHRYRFQYRADQSLRGWAYTIARNLARSWLRRERIRQWMPLDIKDPALRIEPPAMSEDNEIRQQVQAAFARLPVRQREVCSLHLLGGLRLEEIAQIIKTPLGTVKSRLFYGQMKLRDLLVDLSPNKQRKDD
jgi:RNA polymerase sigma-70 factor (ECF subfamily)